MTGDALTELRRFYIHHAEVNTFEHNGLRIPECTQAEKKTTGKEQPQLKKL